MPVLRIIVIVGELIPIVNRIAGVYRNRDRLINFDGISDQDKWHLVARWGP